MKRLCSVLVILIMAVSISVFAAGKAKKAAAPKDHCKVCCTEAKDDAAKTACEAKGTPEKPCKCEAAPAK
jgi:hypothetical protein